MRQKMAIPAQIMPPAMPYTSKAGIPSGPIRWRTAAHVLACTLIPVAVFGILLFTEGKSVMETYRVILNAVFGTRYGF